MYYLYLARTAEIARQLEVKNFVTERLHKDATSEVTMELEEITINSQKLGDLVQSKEVTEGTRKLQAKLAHLEKKIPKNQKGAQTSSASIKTKLDEKALKKKKAAATLKAAAADKDSTADNGKSCIGTNATRTKKGTRTKSSRKDLSDPSKNKCYVRFVADPVKSNNHNLEPARYHPVRMSY
jgi:hypothetical protein